MASKRPHPFTHLSRQDQVPAEPSRKRLKKLHGKPPNLSGNKSFKKAHTVHDLKTRIRSLRRLLEHSHELPATTRQDKERALKSAETELREVERAKRRSEVIGRWHKIRFFERRKSEKRLKRLKTDLSRLDRSVESVDEESRLKKEVEEAEVDLNYAIYFPLEREYVPLFPKKWKVSKGVDQNEFSAADGSVQYERHGDKELWEMVKRCTAEGTLDALRNGTLSSGGDEGQTDENDKAPVVVSMVPHPKVKPKPEIKQLVQGNRRERRKAAAVAAQESDEEKDEAGFFDE